jgi:DNA-binding NarL/FixJ family response regulator
VTTMNEQQKELTKHERIIIRLARQGLKNREIALMINRHYATVRWHVDNIRRKTGLKKKQFGQINLLNER